MKRGYLPAKAYRTPQRTPPERLRAYDESRQNTEGAPSSEPPSTTVEDEEERPLKTQSNKEFQKTITDVDRWPTPAASDKTLSGSHSPDDDLLSIEKGPNPIPDPLKAFEARRELEISAAFHRLPKLDPDSVRPLEEANMLATYGPAKKRLFLFDYDGTLTDIVPNPDKAIIPEILFGWLHKLASEPRNAVWVISGRDQNFLELRLGKLTEVGLVAEHGAFMRRPGSDVWDNLAAKVDMRWRSIVRDAFEAFVDRTSGASIEEKKVAIVLHYRLAGFQHLAAMQAASCKDYLEDRLRGWPVHILSGKCVLEARPSNVDKGKIVERITDEMRDQNEGAPDCILCIGDDVTDEDMFRSLHASELASILFTVTVGGSTKRSEADYYLEDPTEVFATIRMLNECDEAGDVEGLGPRGPDGRHRGSKVLPVPRSYLVMDSD